ncbi:hypothetical protein XENTR_v10010417 [Xenopus tropicalis]|nr:hypothetical protein XENTR_v10010417 [Xenopus tropicalis]
MFQLKAKNVSAISHSDLVKRYPRQGNKRRAAAPLCFIGLQYVVAMCSSTVPFHVAQAKPAFSGLSPLGVIHTGTPLFHWVSYTQAPSIPLGVIHTGTPLFHWVSYTQAPSIPLGVIHTGTIYSTGCHTHRHHLFHWVSYTQAPLYSTGCHTHRHHLFHWVSYTQAPLYSTGCHTHRHHLFHWVSYTQAPSILLLRPGWQGAPPLPQELAPDAHTHL